MPDQDKKEEKKLNYVQGYVSEGGYTIDATNIRKRLAKEAYERYTEREEEELQKQKKNIEIKNMMLSLLAKPQPYLLLKIKS